MQNLQLERELKGIIQTLRLKQLLNIVAYFQSRFPSKMTSQYDKKGMHYVSCSISYDVFNSTGFGRTEEESMTNSIKNLLDTFIAYDYQIDVLKESLKHVSREKVVLSKKWIAKQVESKHEQTLDLEGELLDLSNIVREEKSNEKEGCSCVYYEVHQHHLSQIKHLQARMKLISKENEMLKQLLLKDFHPIEEDKENMRLNI